MTTLSLLASNCGIDFGNDFLASELLKSSIRRVNGVRSRVLGGLFQLRNRRRFCIAAKIGKGKKHDYPWPDNLGTNVTSGHLNHLSHFKPLTVKPKPVTLAFEKPLVDLEKKIIDVRRMADDTGLDFSDQITALEKKYQQALKDLYKNLTPIQRLNLARHPNRPTVLDHIFNITDKWVELHGDRAGYDDPAIVTGLGSMDDKTYMFIGHQKGRNTKENIERNFAMPTPHGYRKALRMMKYADHHGFPIITFVDTPGAFADLKSEELGQGEAIAHNLRAMFGFKVPIISVVTGEGGSGGALAIACANKLYMLENSAFYVASPEACAAILWKSSQAAPKAAEKLKITAQEHFKRKIADGIIPEPLGGAHVDPAWTSQQIKLTITQAMEELSKMSKEELLRHRMLKFRSIGGYQEGIPIDPERKRKMKPSQINTSSNASDLELELESLKRNILEAKGPANPITDQSIKKLKQDIDKMITSAFISMGLQEKLESLKLELSKNPTDKNLNQGFKEKADLIMQEFKRNLSKPGAYIGLKEKLEKLNMVEKIMDLKAKNEKIKNEINSKIPLELKTKMLNLKNAQEKVLKGDALEKDLLEEVEKVKEELKNFLKMANLEVLEVAKRKPAISYLELENVNEKIEKEIEKAINVAGISEKIEKLKVEIAKDSNSSEVEKLRVDIKEGIMSTLNVSDLKEKYDKLIQELKNSKETTMEGDVVGENGRC